LRLLEGPAWILIGAVICAWAYSTGLGTFREPGVGFVAFSSGIFIVIVGGLITLFRRPDQPKIGRISAAPLPRLLDGPAFKLTYTVGLLLFYAFFLNSLGYVITTFIALFGLFYRPSSRRLASPLLASFLSVAVTYFVFEVWLKSQLPRGIFPWW